MSELLKMANFWGPSEGEAWVSSERAVGVAVARETEDPGGRQVRAEPSRCAPDNFVVEHFVHVHHVDIA